MKSHSTLLVGRVLCNSREGHQHNTKMFTLQNLGGKDIFKRCRYSAALQYFDGPKLLDILQYEVGVNIVLVRIFSSELTIVPLDSISMAQDYHYEVEVNIVLVVVVK